MGRLPPHRRCGGGGRDRLLEGIVAVLAILSGLTMDSVTALTSIELPVPARTLTFSSYLHDPIITGLVP